MSELSVGALRGLAANSFEIDIASGSTLDLANAKAGSIPRAALPTGSILQVVSATKTDTFSTASTSFVDVTGLSATITPRSTSNRILCVVTVGSLDGNASAILSGRVLRGVTVIGAGDASGSTVPGAFSRISSATNRPEVGVFQFFDTPSSTSALTYSLQVRTNTGSLFLNRAAGDDGTSVYTRTSSTITLMEVAG